MENFVRAHEKDVIGLLNGFDRLVFRGTIRRLALVGGMASYLHALRVLLKNLGAFAGAQSMSSGLAAITAAERFS